jgi:RimJ/RimL family protein N-acetyltransferase
MSDQTAAAKKWLQPVTLKGSHATLEPLTHARHDELVESVKDGELWNLWFTSVPRPEGMRAEIDRRLGLLDRGTMLPFAVIQNATGKAVGMTTYHNVDAANRRVEVGFTWYRQSVQRTKVNTECKLMLLTHAFESLDFEGYGSDLPDVSCKLLKEQGPRCLSSGSPRFARRDPFERNTTQ